MWLDAAGNVWMADDLVPNRTLAKLDPRTGKVTDYALKGEDGKSIATHSVVVDGVGRVGDGDGNFVLYDTRNGDFKEFRRPAGMRATVGGTLDVDSKGNPWATSLERRAQARCGHRPAPTTKDLPPGRIVWRRLWRLGNLWQYGRQGRQCGRPILDSIVF